MAGSLNSLTSLLKYPFISYSPLSLHLSGTLYYLILLYFSPQHWLSPNRLHIQFFSFRLSYVWWPEQSIGATPDTGVLTGLKLAINTLPLLPSKGEIWVFSLNPDRLCDCSNQEKTVEETLCRFLGPDLETYSFSFLFLGIFALRIFPLVTQPLCCWKSVTHVEAMWRHSVWQPQLGSQTTVSITASHINQPSWTSSPGEPWDGCR